MNGVPEGFVLDAPKTPGVPDGFVLDKPAERDSFGKNTMDVIAELAASANRSVTEFVDFLGPKTVNSILRLSGSDKQMPTLTGAMEGTGIQGGFMDAGVARDTVQTLGQGVTMGGGMVPVTRNLAKAGPAAAEFFGIGAAKTPVIAAGSASQRVLEGLPETERALLENTGDVITATKKLDPSAPIHAPKAIADKAAKETVKQGFEPGFVAMVKSSPQKARQKMAAMVDVVEKGKKNFRFQAENRPLDIAGDSILARIKIVREANRAAGTRLDHVAKSLKGKQVDYSSAVDDFLGDIDEMGVSLNIKDNKMSFMDSDLEGVIGPQRVLKNVINRMRNTKNADAHDIHRMKRFIDEQVTYGKNARGLGGNVERVLKKLRHNLDSILDENFTEYNKVNTQYSETVGVLDELQDVAGKKMRFDGDNADKALGTLSRRLLSNAQSRIPLKDAVNNLDTVAKKYISPNSKEIVPYGYIAKKSGVKLDDLDDDIMGQIMFVDELEKMFGTPARTSLQGDLAKVADRTAELSQKTGVGMVAEAGKAAIDYSRNVNEQAAMKAIKELLEGLK